MSKNQYKKCLKKPIFASTFLIIFINLLNLALNSSLSNNDSSDFQDSTIFSVFIIIMFIKLLMLMNLFIVSKFLKKPQSKNENQSFLPKVSLVFFQITPFLDNILLIQTEMIFFENHKNNALFLCFILPEFLFQNLISFLHFGHKWSFFLSFIILMNFLTLSFFGTQWKFFMIIFLKLISIVYLFYNFYKNYTHTENDDFDVPLTNILNCTNEGIFFIKENQNSLKIKFQNEKIKEFFDFPAKKITIDDIEGKFTEITFKKIKNRMNFHESNSTIHTPLDLKIKKTFNSLSEILKFYQNIAESQKRNILLNFRQQPKNGKDYGLNILLKREISENDIIYMFFIRKLKQKTKKIVEIKEYNVKSDSQNRLLSAFTHELKTPLNGSIPILQEVRSQITKDACIYVDRAIASLKVLENSLNNIIDYSLTVSNLFIIHLSNVDLEELLGEVFLIVKSQIELKHLDFTIDVDEDLINTKIKTDYNRLRQLILNVLLNSIQFTDKGSINLSVSHTVENPLTICFKVEDTGIGISGENLEKLRQKLKLGEKEDSEINSTGFCLGLLMSQNFSLLLGQNGLVINSELDNGTIVNFSIINQINKNVNKERSNYFAQINSHESISKIHKNGKFSMFSHNCEIKENSDLLNSRRSNNLQTQKNRKAQSSMNFEQTNSDLNLENILRKYDNAKDFINTIKKSKSSISFIKDLKGQMKPKTIYSLHSMNMFSPLLKSVCSNTKTLKMVEENDCDCKEILIVDDDPFNILSLEMILKCFNFSSEKALNGAEAIKILKERAECEGINCRHSFQIVFMDYQMPIMDGVQTTIEILKLIEEGEIQSTPIIGCTAFTAKDQIENCLNAGMKDVIFKPLSKNVIGNILKEWI